MFPSFLEGVFIGKGNFYILIILLLVCVLGLKYVMMNNKMIKKEGMNEISLDNREVESKGKEEEEEEGNQTIPKNIIQTWKTRDIPSKYKPLQKGLISKNLDYQYMFFTDEDIASFLKLEYPEYYITFQKLPILIQKIDFFRYIAIYHFGGFYFDLDMECMNSLDDEILKYNTVIPIDDKFSQSKKDLNRQWMDYKGEKVILGQYAFGAVKNSSFMKYLADNIHSNIDLIVKDYNTKIRNNISNFEYFVYSTTGPDYVTYLYKNYSSKGEVFILDYSMRQHFGRYARHRYFGTWKNNRNN
jgi:hypothetical protein